MNLQMTLGQRKSYLFKEHIVDQEKRNRREKKQYLLSFFLQTLSILDLPLKAASPRGVKSQMKNGLAWGLFYKIYSSIVQGHLDEPGRLINSSISWKKHFSINRFSMMPIFFKKTSSICLMWLR